MKFLSIDIETTGLDESYCQVLEVAAVIGDLTTEPVDELPSWVVRLYHQRVVGQPFALHMNAEIIRDMDRRPVGHNYRHPDSVWSDLTCWLEIQGFRDQKLTVAGKNYATFDRRFLSLLPRWDNGKFRHRVIDPAMLFWVPEVDDVLPDTATCIQRANLEWDSKRLHSAVWDARLVVELVRAGSKNLRN